MTKRFIYLLSVIITMDVVTLFGQEGTTKAEMGMLMLSNNKYPLKHALAYEMPGDDEATIVVVLSGQAITNEQLKKARDPEEGGYSAFKKPFLQLVFKKTGELKYWSAVAGSTTIGNQSGGQATAEVKVVDGRAIGKASQAVEPDAMFPSSFDVRFETPLLKAGESLPESTAKKGGPAANVKPTVTGVFTGNGKDAKLAYVSARWGQPFDGKPGIVLVFTEKDHAKDSKPDFNATFGKFGSALVISMHEDGEIYGCEVTHNAMQKKGFSSIGHLEATDFVYGNGKVEGELTTNGEADFFGEKWGVNLKFVAPLGEIPKESQVAESPKEAAVKSSTTEEEPDKEMESKPAAGAPKAHELALTKDATDVEYKELVEQLEFKSKSDVKSVCKELAANLNGQGWSNDGPDLVNSNSSILKRKHGAATLTIFVKPANGGSEVKMMTEGLSWDAQ
jgi:hypothetical protein